MAVSLGRLEVETADHVGLTIGAAIIGSKLPPSLATQLAGVTGFTILLSWVAYFVLLEWLWNGQTPGKRRSGLRVIGADGEPARFTAVLIRNLLRPVDFLPAWYALGAVSIFLSSRSQRLGDLAGGTYVVRAPKPQLDWLSLRTLDPALSWTPGPQQAPIPASASVRLSGESQRLVREFVARERALAPADRSRLAAAIAGPLRAAAPDVDAADDVEFLRRIAASLRASGSAPPAAARPRADDPLLAARTLSAPAQQLVRTFAAREATLDPVIRARIAASIAATVRAELPAVLVADDVALLRTVAKGLDPR
jgi:uncharacterized RDD family membrane protein YckC